MALLIVDAASEDTIAAPDNRETNYICVSVTRGTGKPVNGLKQHNFQVDPMIVGPGGALVDIMSAEPVRIPGTYILRVVPIREETWKAGRYIFAVAVKQGDHMGQGLTSVLMD